jgi:hypothetical protein
LFLTLDLICGYWQVALHPNYREKTAFSACQGLWHFTVVPFGPDKASPTFEWLMESVLRSLTYKTCLVPGWCHRRQFGNLRKVFWRFRGAHLKLNLAKCQLFQEGTIPGMYWSPEGVITDQEKLESAQRWPPLRGRHELMSVLGFWTRRRRFTAGFATSPSQDMYRIWMSLCGMKWKCMLFVQLQHLFHYSASCNVYKTYPIPPYAMLSYPIFTLLSVREKYEQRRYGTEVELCR